MKNLVMIIGLYLAVALQLSVAAPFGASQWGFDIILLLLIYYSSFSSRAGGILWALAGGILLDVFDPASMGGHLVAKTTAILLFGIADGSLNLSQPAILGAILLLLSILDRMIFRLFSPFISNYGWALLRVDLPSAVLTALLGFILLYAAMRFGFFLPGRMQDADDSL